MIHTQVQWCNGRNQLYKTPTLPSPPKKNLQIEQTGLFCLGRMTVYVSHLVCATLVLRGTNSMSLSQSTQSRGLKM